MASIDDLLNELNNAVDDFNKSLRIIQSNVLAEVELLIKELTINNGNIVQDVANLKRLNEIYKKLKDVTIPPEYKQRVVAFGRSFNTVTNIQNEYFTALLGEYTAPAIIAEIKNLAISETVAALTEQGINSAITNNIGSLIKESIETGGKYTDLTKQLAQFINGDKDNIGAYEKYVNQITIDAINTYSANYNKAVTDDLGLEWFMYVGALVGDSREFCQRLVGKRYVHKSELPEIIKGNIDGVQVPIYARTGLPQGMIAGTNENNFQTRRGGYRCNHQLMPITDSRVPEEIRKRIKIKDKEAV